MINLRQVRVGIPNINAKNMKDDQVECIGAGLITDNTTNVVTGHYFECSGAKGSSFRIKTPPGNQADFDEIQRLIRKNEVVTLIPVEPVVSLYAFLDPKGNLLSGVSVKADSVLIASKIAAIQDDDDIEI